MRTARLLAFVLALLLAAVMLTNVVVPSACLSLTPDDWFWYWVYNCGKDAGGGGGSGAGN